MERREKIAKDNMIICIENPMITCKIILHIMFVSKINSYMINVQKSNSELVYYK